MHRVAISNICSGLSPASIIYKNRMCSCYVVLRTKLTAFAWSLGWRFIARQSNSFLNWVEHAKQVLFLIDNSPCSIQNICEQVVTTAFSSNIFPHLKMLHFKWGSAISTVTGGGIFKPFKLIVAWTWLLKLLRCD